MMHWAPCEGYDTSGRDAALWGSTGDAGAACLGVQRANLALSKAALWHEGVRLRGGCTSLYLLGSFRLYIISVLQLVRMCWVGRTDEGERLDIQSLAHECLLNWERMWQGCWCEEKTEKMKRFFCASWRPRKVSSAHGDFLGK